MTPGPLEVRHRDGGIGRGLYALRDIAAGELVERSPVVELSERDTALLMTMALSCYSFSWHSDNEAAIPLGYGALFNHSYTPNVRNENDIGGREIRFYATRLIPAGTEATLDYTEGGAERVWFEAR